MKKGPRYSIWKFWAVVTVCFILLVTLPELWPGVHRNIEWILWRCRILAAVSFATAGLLGLLIANRQIFVILFPPLAVLGGVVAYYSVAIGVGLTPLTLEQAVVNDMTIWISVINTEVIIAALTALTAAILAVVVRWKYVRPSRRQRGLLFDIAMLMTITCCFFSPINPLSALGGKLPYSIPASFCNYLSTRITSAKIRSTYSHVNVSSAPNCDAPDVILVLGEALRADHLPQNGYDRNTMPRLSADSSWISIARVYTAFGETNHSVPRILTSADEHNPEEAYTRQSMISLMAKAGYSTAWFANQERTESYAYFATEPDTLISVSKNLTNNPAASWLDADIIEPFAKWLASAKKPLFAVVHTIGSHAIYSSHYTRAHAVFKPEMTDIGFITQSREQIINSYDNTIIATDEFLWQLASMLLCRNAIIIYISDHGESLGENGQYLHGNSSDEVHYPACLVWFSPEYARRNPDKVEALRANRHREFTTDNIFHSVVDASLITTDAPDYNPALSIFHAPKPVSE